VESVELRLIVTHGPNLGHEYLLEGEDITIGRSTNNSIVLPSPEISRRHAHLWLDGEFMFVEDLGSTNGTFVNNARLYNQVKLYDGDEIQVGDSFRLLFTSPGGAARPPTQPHEEEVSTQNAAGSGDQLTANPVSDIASTTLENHELVLEQPQENAQQRPTILWFAGGALVLLLLCLLMFLLLDAYDQGRLLYCGSLRPLFSFLLGPVGFNPLCP
jgi:pSer/pThr/pTyr-binding forkhead associated (FHA) protein